MVRFSERYGYKPVRGCLQFECMDEELRISLWNFLNRLPIKEIGNFSSIYDYNPLIKNFYMDLWEDFWKKPLDDLLDYNFNPINPFDSLKDYFFSCEWFEIYDLLEFFIEWFPFGVDAKGIFGIDTVKLDIELGDEWFEYACNKVLESEKAAYRMSRLMLAKLILII